MEKSFYTTQTEKDLASRDNLDNYLKFPSKITVLILTGIIVVLVIGVSVMMFKDIQLSWNVLIVSEKGQISMFVSEDDFGLSKDLDPGDEILILGQTCKILEIPVRPINVGINLDPYYAHEGEFDKDEWIYEIKLKGNLLDQVSKIKVNVSSLHVRNLIYGDLVNV